MFASIWSWLKALFGSPDPATVTPAPVAVPAPDSGTPWMDWLKSHIGEIEKTGARPPTEFDKEVFSHTDDGTLAAMDEGCAATLCAALEESGYKSPHSALAASFDSYGAPSALKYGAIVRFQWSSGGHHVSTVYATRKDGFVDCLGGNQSSELKVSTYPVTAIKAIRWPVKA